MRKIKVNINLKRWLAICVCLLCITIHTIAQDSYKDKVRKYVNAYQDLAIQEQVRSGVPASITLGQGILETEAGCSELATSANNHFGIKCKKEWKGQTFTHTDDAPNECFRMYSCAGDSYKDHSDYLRTGHRYEALFKLSPTDYAAWAYGLKKCGYATSPVYAQKLIKIIEDFELQEYTYKALNDNMVYKQPKPKEDVRYAAAFHENIPATDSPTFKKMAEEADEARSTIITTQVSGTLLPVNTKENTGGILSINGLKAIKAFKGDLLLQYAVQYNLRYEKILEYNDLPDAPLTMDMYLYLEKKPTRGRHESHIVQDGETMWQVAQDEPMQLQRLLAYNRLQPGEEAAPGSVLMLQSYAREKPKLNDAPRFIGDDLPRKDAAPKPRQDDYIVKDAAAQPESTAATATTAPAASATETVVVTTPAPETKEVTAPVHIDAAPTTTTQAAPMPQEPQDELGRLKARLDKIVYAGDDKTAIAPAQLPAKTISAPVATKPAPVVHEEKKQPLPKQGAAKYYTVKKGDTAFSIAKRNNMTVAELQELNDMKKPTIEIGQQLKVK